MPKSRDNYDADELDRTIEAVLAAASKVSVAPDGYTDPNWNTGNANNNNNSRNPSQLSQQSRGNSQVPLPGQVPQNYYQQQQQQQNNNNNNNQYPYQNNHNQPGQHQQVDGYSQVTPRTAQNSARNNNNQHQQQVHPDDDVEALTEAMLQKKYPGSQSQSQSQPHSARGSGLPQNSSRSHHTNGSQNNNNNNQATPRDNLDGTRNGNWQQNNNNNNNYNSPNANNNGVEQQPPSQPTSGGRHVPESIRKQQEKERLERENQARQDSNNNNSNSNGRSMRSPEQNARLKADNDFVIRRMELWQYKKDRERIQAEYERQERELEGCTFQPDVDGARREVEVDPNSPCNLSPSTLYYNNHAWGFDSFVRRQEIARERREEKDILDAEAFMVKGPAAARLRSGQQRTTVPEPFEFASGTNHNSKRLEHHLMTSGRTNVGGQPGGPSLIALRRGQPLHPHQGIKSSQVEKIAEERSRIRQESGTTVPSGAFSQHGAWKDIANPV